MGALANIAKRLELALSSKVLVGNTVYPASGSWPSLANPKMEEKVRDISDGEM